MSKNENKTKPNEYDVETFLLTVDDKKRAESIELIRIMKAVSGEDPVMWGKSIIGFGAYHYRYASGREGDWMRIGFSPRKSAISLYISCDADQFSEELTRLGKHTRGKGCIYVKTLEDIDEVTLKEMLKKAYDSPQFKA